jgi:hypothetical protein
MNCIVTALLMHGKSAWQAVESETWKATSPSLRRNDATMAAYLILASVIFISGASAGILLTVIIGIHRGDHGKRLTGPAASNSEAFARRLLAASRGYNFPDDAGEGQ